MLTATKIPTSGLSKKRPLGSQSSVSCVGEDDEPVQLTQEQLERKKANAKAMMRGTIRVERKPFLANGILSCGAFKRFQPPGDPSTYSKSLTKKLGGGLVKGGGGFLQSKFVSGTTFSKLTAAPRLKLTASANSVDSEVSSDGESTSSGDESDEDKPEFLPHEPLVVWDPTPEQAADGYVPIQVPTILAQFLRPHQRAGVEFCCECLLGMREFDGHGCILADDMGLGKTLQSIATLYTMLRCGKRGPEVPLVKRCIVVCPCSLVNNWAQEFEKWVNSRVKTDAERIRSCAISATDKKSVTFAIAQFLHASRPYDVLVISYETFRMYTKKFTNKNDFCCDLLICDEAHRLKNPDALTTKALASLACRRRVLLSGTPVQNDLDEFFAMADFTNPGVLGTAEEFRRRYKNPILIGREPGASQAVQDQAKVLQNEMSNIVNQFILRRTNTINAKFLPDKLVQVVCCKLTPMQSDIYRFLLGSKDVQAALSGKVKDALSYIQNLQKLCNHPKILELSVDGKSKMINKEQLVAFGVRLDQTGDEDAVRNAIKPELSGKMMVLHNLMDVMWKDQTAKKPPEKIVVISIYTQTLDLVERMCKGKKWPVVRLDGSLAVKKRMEMVNSFNDPTNRNAFVFLLSSKAGGCGINLIGANRLVLFDSDWNPATDKQAAARCWRDGQKKHCYTYRFLSAGTLEEKIFQRQLSKEGLAAVVEDKEQVNALSSGDLKQLFKLRENTPSDTHDKLQCTHCRLALEEDSGAPASLGPAQVDFLDEVLDWIKILPESECIRGDVVSDGGGGASSAATAAAAAAAQPPGGMLDDARPADGAGAPAAVDGVTAAAAVAKAKAKAKMGNLKTIHKKLHENGYSKLTEFHKDVRQIFAAARKVYPQGSKELNDLEVMREHFEEHWSNVGAQISALSTSSGARVFTEEELANAASSIEAQAASAAAGGSSRNASRFKFNKPVNKPMGASGGLLVPATKAAAASSSNKEESAAEVESSSRRSSLSQAPFKPQHEMPKEEDLNNWSHHFSVDSVEDHYLKQATSGSDLVTFVFGLKVTWDLTQKQQVLDEGRDAADKERRDQTLEDAKARIGTKKGKKAKKTGECAEVAGLDEVAAGAEEWATAYNSDDGGMCDDAGGAVDDVVPPSTGNPMIADEAITIYDDEGAEPPPIAAASKALIAEKTCEFCTLSNPAKAKKCQACGQKLYSASTPKAKAAPKAPKRPKMDSAADPNPTPKARGGGAEGAAKKAKAVKKPAPKASPPPPKASPPPPPQPAPVPPPPVAPVACNLASDDESGDDDFE